mmetsp:Transcript_31839/g.54440  ORF Transcript_31839/g.54440 Transcript_31839/m.54440 type:complete len:564 (+) Transcript_31839:52-1743(+)
MQGGILGSSLPGVNDKTTRVPWSSEEELLLLPAAERFGRDWEIVARLFPNRTADAVRNRHNRLITQGGRVDLDAGRGALEVFLATRGHEGKPIGEQNRLPGYEESGRAAWTAAEDQLIAQCVQRFGLRWRQIASHLPDRSDSAVRNRWMRLNTRRQREAAAATTGRLAGEGAGNDQPKLARYNVTEMPPRRKPSAVAMPYPSFASGSLAPSLLAPNTSTAPSSDAAWLLHASAHHASAAPRRATNTYVDYLEQTRNSLLHVADGMLPHTAYGHTCTAPVAMRAINAQPPAVGPLSAVGAPALPSGGCLVPDPIAFSDARTAELHRLARILKPQPLACSGAPDQSQSCMQPLTCRTPVGDISPQSISVVSATSCAEVLQDSSLVGAEMPSQATEQHPVLGKRGRVVATQPLADLRGRSSLDDSYSYPGVALHGAVHVALAACPDDNPRGRSFLDSYSVTGDALSRADDMAFTACPGDNLLRRSGVYTDGSSFPCGVESECGMLPHRRFTGTDALVPRPAGTDALVPWPVDELLYPASCDLSVLAASYGSTEQPNEERCPGSSRA